MGVVAVRGGGSRRWAGALVLLAAALAAAIAGGGSAQGDPVCQTSWTAGNGQFTNAANWSAGVPNGSTHGCINLSVTVTLTGGISVTGVTVGPGATLSLASGADLNLGATGLVNDGTVRLGGGGVELDARSGATVENRSLIVAEGASGTNYLLGGTVLNSGTLDVTNQVQTEGAWTNTGTIDVNTGASLVDWSTTSMTLGTDSVLSGGGSFTLDNGGATWTWAGTGGSITMTDPPRISNRTVTFTDVGTGTVELFGGNTIQGTIGSGQTLRVSSGADANISASIVNKGTVRMFGGSAEFDGRTGGATVDNRGTFVAQGVSGTNYLLAATVLNSGTIDVNSQLQTEGNWTNTGTIDVDGDLVDWSTTSMTMGTDSVLSGGGSFTLDNGGATWTWAGNGGSITMANPPRVANHAFAFTDVGAGTVELFGGNTIQGTIGTQQTLRVSSGADANINASIVNKGTVRMFGGSAEFDGRSGGASVDNRGTFVAQGAGGTNYLLAATVLNSGSISVTTQLQTEGAWTNTGTIDVDGDLVDWSTTSMTMGTDSVLSGSGSFTLDNGGATWTWAGNGGSITMANPPRVANHAFTFTDVGAGAIELFGGNTIQGTIGTQQTLRVSSGADANINASIVNKGTVRMFGGSAEFDGRSGGASVDNRGTFVAQGAGGTNYLLAATVLNSGSISVTTQLQTEGAWTVTGSIDVGLGASLVDWSTTSVTLGSGSLLSGAGSFTMDNGGGTWTWAGTGGQITMTDPPRIANHSFTFTNAGSGAVELFGGNTIEGTIGTQQTLRVSSGADANINASIVNTGTVRMFGGSAEFDGRSGGATVTNAGTFVAQGSGTNYLLAATVLNSGTIGVSSQLQTEGAWTNTGTIDIDPAATLIDWSTTDLVTTGSGTGGGSLVFDNGGSTLQGDGNFTVAANIRHLVPGQSPGTLGLAALTLPSGTTEMEIGGATPGAHDRIDVAGLATLGGTLQLSAFGGYTPTACDVITLMTWGSRSGTFSSITGTTIGGVTFTPVYQANALVLVGTPTGTAISANPTSVNVSESGTTATYDVCAAGTVTVTPDPDAQVTVSPPSLTFGPGNPNEQTVTVTAVDDAVLEGAHVGTITHTAGNGDPVPSVTANIADNDAVPVANDDNAATQEDVSVNIDVLANDVDDSGFDLSSVEVVSPPSSGTATPNPDGTIEYVPDPDTFGGDSFTYRVRDDGGILSNVATVSVNVTSVNDPPVATDDTANTGLDTPVDVDVLANDTDVETPLTVSGFDAASVQGGTVAPGPGQTLRYTPPAGYVGPDSFGYTAQDGAGDTDSAVVAVTVQPIAGIPPVAVGESDVTDEDVPVTIDVVANDTDADGTIDPTTVVIDDPPENGTATVNPDGTVTYLGHQDFHGTSAFSYTVDDDSGLTSNSVVVNVTVNPVNDAPTAVDDQVETDEETPIAVDALANDHDVDGDAIGYDPSTFQHPTRNGGTITQRTDGRLQYTPPPTEQVEVAPGTPGAVAVMVPVAPAPTPEPAAPPATVPADEPVVEEPATEQADAPTSTTVPAEQPAPTTTTTTVPLAPEASTPEPEPAPVAAAAPAPAPVVERWVLPIEFVGVDTFPYTIVDGGGETATGTVTVTVGPVEPPPPPPPPPPPEEPPPSGPPPIVPGTPIEPGGGGEGEPSVDAPPAVGDPVTPPEDEQDEDEGDEPDTEEDGPPAVVLSDALTIERQAVIIGDDLVIEGRISGECSAVEVLVNGDVAGTVPVEADGSFVAEAPTEGLSVGEHAGAIRCVDGGEPVPFDFIVAQRTDQNGVGSGTLLVALLAFLAVTNVLVVALPQPQAARRRTDDEEEGA